MTAYHQILEHIDKGMLSEGRDLHVAQGLSNLANSLGLEIEVEADYAGFHAIQQSLTDSSVEAALANIRRLIAHRQSRFMPS